MTLCLFLSLASLMLLGVWMGSPAAAHAGAKMDFTLKKALRSDSEGKDLSQIPGVYYKNGKPYVKFFMKLKGPQSKILNVHMVVRARSGDVVVAAAPVDQLPALASLSQVVRMEGASPVATSLDLSVPDIRADEVWFDPVMGSNEGQGVLVGIVDSGVSLDHENFKDAQGNSRILYVWDMTDDGGPAPEEDVCGFWDDTGVWNPVDCGGSECDNQTIIDENCRQQDEDEEGHGTGVMGVLAGDGSADCGQVDSCKGVAPRADMIVVKIMDEVEDEDVDSTDVAEGVAYIFSKADGLGMPAVVNLSLSWFTGPRDGSSLAESFISDLTGPGRIVVAAAGNEGVMKGHAEANLDDKTSMVAFMGGTGAAPKAGLIEGWYDASNTEKATDVELRLSCDDVLPWTPRVFLTDWLSFGDEVTFGEGPSHDFCGSGVLDFNGETDTARGFSLDIEGSEGNRTWTVDFREGSGSQGKQDVAIDLWINPLDFDRPTPGEDALFVFNAIIHEDELYRRTITPPCTADDVICVSSYNTRCLEGEGFCGVDVGYGVACYTQFEDCLYDTGGSFSAFSSRGPRRDEVYKPEVGAPGQAIIVPTPSTSEYKQYAKGTSLAAPHMAGIAALILSADSSVSPSAIISGIETTAREWHFPQGIWEAKGDRGWRGYGKLDAFALVEMFFPLPEPPTNLMIARMGSNQVKLTWGASPTQDVTAYNIYGDGGAGDTTQIDYTTPLAQVAAPATEWTSGSLAVGRTYSFGVRAQNDSGEEKNTSVTVQIFIPIPPVIKALGLDDDWCFIASAAFASPEAPQVDRLREIRDRVLLKTAWGRQFVQMYYKLSPPVAQWLREKPAASWAARMALLPAVGCAEVLYHRTLNAWLPVPLCALSLFALFGARSIRQRNHKLKAESGEMMKRIPGLLLLLFLILFGATVASAQDSQEAGEKDRAPSDQRPLFLNVKGAWHSFWSSGVFRNGAAYGRPGFDAADMQGVGGEVEVDYQIRKYLLFSAAVGGYQGNSERHNVSLITAYGIATAKLQNKMKSLDYYAGLGVGGYFTYLDADGTSNAFQPGVHGVVGVRIHLTPAWSLLLEDRVAFTMRAKSGFGDIDLGGNFVLLGCSYQF